MRPSETLLERLQAVGTTLLLLRDHSLTEAFEAGIAEGRAICGAITGWENRWGQRNLLDQDREAISPRGKPVLARAGAMTHADCQSALARREEAQARFTRIAPLADAVIALACLGLARRPARRAAQSTTDGRLRLRCTLLHALRPGRDHPVAGRGGECRLECR